MSINALEIDPGKNWKGIWRWTTQETLCLAGSHHDLRHIPASGATFDEFHQLARMNGCVVTAKRSSSESISSFRSDLHNTSVADDTILVVNFSRSALKQSGVGHFSPIAGYHSKRQLALILDVARYKYPAYWAPISGIWEAMKETDRETSLDRGYFLLKRAGAKINNSHSDYHQETN